MEFTKRPLAAVIIGLLIWIFPLTCFSGTFRDNFDDGNLTGWKQNIGAGISVVNGELELNSPDPVIVKVGDSEWKGYSLEAKVKIAKFTNGGWFSIRVFQSNTGDPSGYYELRFAQSGTVATLQVNNRSVESFRVPTTLDENVWHGIRIEPSDGKVLFYLDDIPTAQLTDLGLSGYVDMCATKGTQVYIDEVTIPGPNIPDTGPSGPNSFAVNPRLRAITAWGKIKR